MAVPTAIPRGRGPRGLTRFNGLTIAKGVHDDNIKAKCLRSGSRLMRTGNHGHAICSSCALSLDEKPEQ